MLIGPAPDTFEKDYAPMKKVVAILLDESGSMSANATATVGAVNEMIRNFRTGPDAAEITLFLTRFDSTKLDTKNWPAAEAPDLTDYRPGAATPLLDAMGRTLTHVAQIATVGDKVAFIVQTDGFENASVEYTKEAVAGLVEARKKDGWDFTFLGADFDAFDANAAGTSMGMSGLRSSGYASASVGATMNVMAQSTRSYFSGGRDANAPLTQAELDAMAAPTTGPIPPVKMQTPQTPTPPAGPQKTKRTQSHWPSPA